MMLASTSSLTTSLFESFLSRPNIFKSSTQTCQLCIRRHLHRAKRAKATTVQVELRSAIPSLGKPGDRVSVAPGYMRNHLYPKKLALYVIRRGTLNLDGTIAKSLPLSSTTAPVITSAPSISDLASERAKQSEAKAMLFKQLSTLGPLRFMQPTKSPSADTLYGSVSDKDILGQLQARGLAISELDGSFVADQSRADGLEGNRIKRLGKYTFTANIHGKQMPLLIEVNRQKHKQV